MNSFNCSVSCEGIYADVEWFKGNKGKGRDKMKFRRLVSEYNTFKRNNVQHFKFDPANDSTNFRKLEFYMYNTQSYLLCACLVPFVRRGGATLYYTAGADLLQNGHI